MPVFLHDQLPVHKVPRITTRILAGADNGAVECAVWEQQIDKDGHIPLHYHEVEEVLVILSGKVSLTIDDRTSIVCAPATIVVPPRQVHGLRPEGDELVRLLAIFPVASPKIFAPDGNPRPLPWQDHEGGVVPP